MGSLIQEQPIGSRKLARLKVNIINRRQPVILFGHTHRRQRHRMV
jgi:hypothetical protein